MKARPATASEIIPIGLKRITKSFPVCKKRGIKDKPRQGSSYQEEYRVFKENSPGNLIDRISKRKKAGENDGEETDNPGFLGGQGETGKKSSEKSPNNRWLIQVAPQSGEDSQGKKNQKGFLYVKPAKIDQNGT